MGPTDAVKMIATADPAGESRRQGQLIRGTATYTVGAILQRSVTLLLLPLFTRILSPTEFGQVGILTTIAAAATVLVGFGLETAVFRGIRRAGDDAASRAFTNTVGGFAIAAPLAMAATFSVFGAGPVAAATDLPVDALRLAAAGAALNASATIVPLAILRARERLRDYLHLTAVQVLVTPTLTVILVALLGWGVTGWMLAYLTGNGVLLIRGLSVIGHRWSRRFDAQVLAGSLAFGIPLVPHALSHWGLSVSDRAILGAFVPAAAVGEYYIAYLACLPISLLAIATAQASQPLFSDGHNAGDDFGIGWMSSIQAALVVGTAIAVALLGPPAVALVLPSAYAGSAVLIPPLALGTALFGLYLMPMNAVTLSAGRTGRVWLITVLAALVNMTLNLTLIPRFGTLAAAVNTILAYGLLLVGVSLYMARVCERPLRYDLRRLLLALLILGLPAAIAAALTPSNTWLGLVTRTTLLAASIVCVLAGPFRRDLTRLLDAMRGRP